MMSKTVLALCVVASVAVAAQAQAGGWPMFGGWGAPAAAPAWGLPAAPAFIPPWTQFMPQWAPCTTIGADCLDCHTKVVCTKVGGIEKACSDPLKPYCNLGECSATPSATCAPAPAPAAPAAAGAA
ncbi:unnamed protein product [Plutella xylostella]|uniref:(diamondback moth) hypothetical protein n=1 Tax=Plutella xylostella TaxID=51655 RepID=A0A8S4FTS6_PLUXY|nr:uncharacterized protein LOC105388127 [Plutella xylostella]CAG9130564.1 unnamed protein product [Plutella xylostella]